MLWIGSILSFSSYVNYGLMGEEAWNNRHEKQTGRVYINTGGGDDDGSWSGVAVVSGETLFYSITSII